MRWKQVPEAPGAVDAGVPDALAVFEGGELVSWDQSAVHAYYAERGELCDGECAARGHIEPS